MSISMIILIGVVVIVLLRLLGFRAKLKRVISNNLTLLKKCNELEKENQEAQKRYLGRSETLEGEIRRLYAREAELNNLLFTLQTQNGVKDILILQRKEGIIKEYEQIERKIKEKEFKIRQLESEYETIRELRNLIDRENKYRLRIDSLQKSIKQREKELGELQLITCSYQQLSKKQTDKLRELRETGIELEKTRENLKKARVEESEQKERLEELLRYANQRIEQEKKEITKEEDVPSVLKKIAKAWGDYQYLIWDKAIAYLLVKKRPISYEKADEFRAKLKEYRDDVFVKYKEIEYKYDYLISLFPEIQEYIDGNVVQNAVEDAYTEYEDRREKYLTKEEWMALSDTEKSQRALDKYNENRTNAQVGRDYEEYIAYLFREQRKGCIIEMFGEQRGLKDLGRDLIVKHKGKVFIVQCKRWSADREIREKHIMQLFGTTIEYCWDMKRRGVHPLDMVGKSVIPVFVTTAKLSDTARQFAEKLDVVVAEVPNGDYAQIKCNVGREGEKIYHLPFDQQYNKVIIEPEKGEFYAWTVEEAEQRGFRRARKYYNV